MFEQNYIVEYMAGKSYKVRGRVIDFSSPYFLICTREGRHMQLSAELCTRVPYDADQDW